MKKSLLATVGAAVAGAACLCAFAFAGCGEDTGSSVDYSAIAGAYSIYAQVNDTSDPTNQVNDTWDNVLTLNADQSYSYKMAATDMIYGSLVYGKLAVTTTGTYTAVEKSSGVYTITLSEATALTGTASLIKDPVNDRDLADYNITLSDVNNLSVTSYIYDESWNVTGSETIDCKFTFCYATRTFDLDTTVAKDSYDSCEDPLLTQQSLMMYIEALRQANSLGISEY